MFYGIRDLVLCPDAFFERVSKEKINLVPLLVIIGAGIFFTLLPLATALTYYTLTSQFNWHYIGFGALIRIYFLSYVAVPLITWGILFLGAFIIARILGGVGSLLATIQNTGYGMLPWVVFMLGTVFYSGILFLIAYLAPTTTPWMEEYVPYGYEFFPFISLIIVCWQWYLWALAIGYTHGFTIQKAIAVTIVPVVIIIWLTIPVQEMIKTVGTVVSVA